MYAFGLKRGSKNVAMTPLSFCVAMIDGVFFLGMCVYERYRELIRSLRSFFVDLFFVSFNTEKLFCDESWLSCQ